MSFMVVDAVVFVFFLFLLLDIPFVLLVFFSGCAVPMKLLLCGS